MIFDQLVLHNFGQYKGRHFVDLAPPSRDRPVVLVGALNGGGKTTLLDALQLALFGRFAPCSNRGELAYDEFLRRSINRNVDPSEGASVELRFRHTHEGTEHSYHVLRTWVARDRTMRETVEVVRDREVDPLLTDEWAEQVEQFLPAGLSQFFFFDGEKIEALADLERSSEALSTAVRTLLGLDLVDQLSTDLVVLERRKRGEQRDSVELAAIDEAEREVKRLADEREVAVQNRSTAQLALDVAERELRVAEDKFRRGGGEIYAKRAEIQGKRSALDHQRQESSAALTDEAGGAAPLLLLSDMLQELAGRVAQEHDAETARVVSALLDERDTATIAAAREAGADRAIVAALKQHLASDRKSRQAPDAGTRVFQMTTEARADLAGLGAQERPLRGRLRRFVSEHDRLVHELEKLDRQLANVPHLDRVARLASERDQAVGDVAKAREALRLADEELAKTIRDHEGRAAALERLQDEVQDDRFRKDVSERVVNHSARVREVLSRFRTAVAERHIARLESLILEGFQHLVRKSSLVTGLRIDPQSYRVALTGDGGKEMSPDRLSAGERQLLAVSIIWALARASGRPIPVVVDTPLGRLDSQHRAHMVERYFPFAGAQVIVLSTDEEIDVGLHAKLRPALGRQYRVDYDEKGRTSRIEKGYFW